MSDFVTLLVAVVRLLASCADEQIAYLVKLGIRGNVDELALEYDDLVRSARSQLEEGRITKRQYDLMLQLDQKLDEMSGSDKADLWTEQALYDSTEWTEVRKMARECLLAFDAE